MADQEDKSSKTEEPTERKLRKAREQGNVPKSREVNNLFMMLAVLLAVGFTIPYNMGEVINTFGGIFSDAGNLRMNNGSAVGGILQMVIGEALAALAPTFILTIVLALFGGFIQNGIIFSTEPIVPKLSKISLIKGFERMFSMKSVVEFLKSLLKLIIIGAATGFVITYYSEHILLAVDRTPFEAAVLVQTIFLRMIMAAIAIMLLIAVTDFLFQRQQFNKEQRMSQREIKDEMKETEGDPFIKARQRQIRQERARQRMMTELPSADVVITNPTHFSVALRYEADKDAAPKVIAKGADHIAFKIREVAKEHEIPLYEDPPLARQLYYMADIDDMIPLELYETVAKVIAYVFNLKKKKKAA